jgi:aldehyde dehydrogenase (NAD+)
VIFADADEKAVKRGVLHMMNNTGQSCNAPSPDAGRGRVYDQAVETAAEVAAEGHRRPRHEEGRHIGPVVNETQWARSRT